MRDYTKLYPDKTPYDAARAYVNYLHNTFSKVTKGDYGCHLAERQDGCHECNLRKLLGQPDDFKGGCCGWTLAAMDPEKAIEVLETACDIEVEKGNLTYMKFVEE